MWRVPLFRGSQHLLQKHSVSLCFPLEKQMLHFLVAFFFFFSPMSGISSRICSFIFHDSKQNGSLRGGSFRNTTFCDASVLKGSACQFRRHKSGFDPWVRKIPWRRKWQPTPLKLPRKFHGQSSLAGYSTGGGGQQKVGHN